MKREDRPMTPERWQRATEILHQALAFDSGERRRYLKKACGADRALRREVEDLLEFEQVEVGVLDRPLGGEAGAAGGAMAPPAYRGRRIGPYKVLRSLGEGGMGDVLLALRDDLEMQVALKLIRREQVTPDLLTRFERERRILAQLDHPNIARIFDGGTTDEGLPYFAMEYVEGVRIDHYCDRERLDVRRRLRLFLKVCSALEASHQNLVLHLDLKPGNVLVTAGGEPKLLDFGIAKVLTPEDLSGADGTGARPDAPRPMTVRYAGPEQVDRQPVTTATDVYALGVILYELLTGHPHLHLEGCDGGKRARLIREQEPLKPSLAVRRRVEVSTRRGITFLTPRRVSETRGGDPRKLRRILAGDLDAVVLKALHKKPEHRYGTVAELAGDLRRYLEGRPVLARQGGFLYDTGKFAKRYRGRLAAAGLVLALAGAGYEAAARARENVRVEMKVVEKLAEERIREMEDSLVTRSELLNNLFIGRDFNQPLERFTVPELLDRAEARIRDELEKEPLATQLESLGLFYVKRGLREKSRELLEECLEIRRSLYSVDDSLLARALNNMAAWYQRGDLHRRAEPLYREALAMRLRLGQTGLELAKTQSNLAAVLMNRGEYSEAETLYQEVKAVRTEELEPDDLDVAKTLRSLGTLYYLRSETGDLQRAEPILRRALEIRLKKRGERHSDVLAAKSSLARLLHARGRFSEAEELFRAVLKTRREELREGHRHIALTEKGLARLYLDQGRVEEAGELLRRVLPLLREALPPDAWHLADGDSLWGAYLLASGKPDEAEELLVEGYRQLKRLRGEAAIYTRNAHQRVVDLYAARGEPVPAWL